MGMSLKKVRQEEIRLTHRKVETLKSGGDSSGPQQAFPLVTFQLGMGEHPLRMCSSAGLAFFSAQPGNSTIFAYRKLGLADRPGEFVSRVPFAHLLALDQHDQHGLDILNSFFERHAAPYLSMPLSLAFSVA
jgi:hypothetical protein